MKLIGLTPMLETDDVEATVKFYTEMLGFKCVGAHPDAKKPIWARVRRDAVEIMFTTRNKIRREFAECPRPTMTGSLYLRVDDVDAMWKRLTPTGSGQADKVTVEYPPENFDYGMREFAIRDNNGYLVQFGQEIPE